MVACHLNTHGGMSSQHTWWHVISTHMVACHLNTHGGMSSQHTWWHVISTHMVACHLNTHGGMSSQHTWWHVISTHMVACHLSEFQYKNHSTHKALNNQSFLINPIFDNPVLQIWTKINTKCKNSYKKWFNNPVDSVIRTISWGMNVCGLVRNYCIF